MSTKLPNVLRFGLALILTGLFLAACGGGSDAGGAAKPEDKGPATSTAVSPLVNYQGAWQKCDTGLSQAMPQVIHNSYISRLVFSSVSNTGEVTITSSFAFFTSTDCTGNAYATVTGTPISAIANGTKTVNLDTVNKLDLTQSAGTTSYTGANVAVVGTKVVVSPVGGVPYNFDVNLTAQNLKAIGLVSGTNLDFNTRQNALDAQGYPIAFQASNASRYTR